MFHPQQSSSSPMPPYVPPQSHIVNPNPSFVSFPQPILPPAITPEPPLHPPGTVPYTNSGLLQSNFIGSEGQPQYYAGPNAVSHNLVMTQAESVGYALNPVLQNQVTSTSSNPLWDGHSATLPLEHDATRVIIQGQAKFPVRCDVCKIECNSNDVFDKHVLGKKHRKNLEMQKNSLVVTTTTDTNINMLSQMPNIIGPMLPVASHATPSEDLESKKRKLLDCGTTMDSVMVCNLCNIACNSPEVFNTHLSGKRHAAQAGLGTQIPFVAAIRPHRNSNLKKKAKKNKVVQSEWCEVCKINCNSSDIYIRHLAGKKHLKNIGKVEKAKMDDSGSNALPPSTDPIIGPAENPSAVNASEGDVTKMQKSSAQAPEDLETKKRKILEFGAVAGSVRTCTVCNVVCNSQRVFDSHLAGYKHAMMVRKQEKSGAHGNCSSNIVL